MNYFAQYNLSELKKLFDDVLNQYAGKIEYATHIAATFLARGENNGISYREGLRLQIFLPA